MKLLAFDLEATSLDPSKARIVSAALIPISDDLSIDVSRAIVIDVPVEEAGDSALIHGYTGVNGAESLRVSRLKTLLELIEGYTLVTYSSFDARVLREEARRVSYDTSICYIDVLEMVLATPWGQRHASTHHRLTLDDAVRGLLGLEPIRRRFHDPLADAYYAALLYVHLVKSGLKPHKRCLRAGVGLLTRLLGV